MGIEKMEMNAKKGLFGLVIVISGILATGFIIPLIIGLVALVYLIYLIILKFIFSISMEVKMHKNQLELKTVTTEQLALSNAYQLEAMINVLERKGILTAKEVLDELEVIAVTKGEKEVN